jgi:OOP family OmpA-OmpF porin
MKLRTALLAATVLALPVAVKAQNAPGIVSGPYVGLGAGVNFMQNQNVGGFSGNSATTTFNRDVNQPLHMRTGFVGLGSGGWGFGNGLRLEVEGNFRENAYQSANGVHADGNEKKYGALVNVLYDFSLASYGIPYLVPYAGVGAGYEWANASNFDLSIPGTTGRFNNTEGSFAYQAILGTAFPIAAVPGLELTAEYRFMGLAGSRTYSGSISNAAIPGGIAPASIRLDNNFNHSILVGLRYAFNAAPPPAPPAPAPVAVPAAVTRNYLVFFDWDRADLTDRARQIVAEAAANSQKVQHTRIQVNGYTDTSGTAAYNQRLSVRRAQAVAAELVKDGVPRGVIAIQGFGETRLLVPTGPGVREPQNRRVEIIIQ